MLEKIGKRAYRVPGIIRTSLFLLSCALVAFWVISNSGMYLYASQFQAEYLTEGEYSPWLSGMVAAVVALTPLMVIIQTLAFFYPEPENDVNEGS